MIRKSRHAVEKYLRNKGFTSPESRRIIVDQITLAVAALALGILCLWFSVWPLAFGLGACMAAMNLWLVGRSAHWSVMQNFSAKLAWRYFGVFLLRFAGTGALLLVLLMWVKLPWAPLLAGLFSGIVMLMLKGVSRFAGNTY